MGMQEWALPPGMPLELQPESLVEEASGRVLWVSTAGWESLGCLVRYPGGQESRA